MNEVREADVALYDLSYRQKAIIERLMYKAKYIEDKMKDLYGKLDDEGMDSNINTLGELQSLGPDLDRLCGEFGQIKEMGAIIRRLATQSRFLTGPSRLDGQ